MIFPWIRVLALVAVVSTVAGGFWYVKSLQKEVTSLSTALETETLARKLVEADFDQFRRQSEAAAAHRVQLQGELNETREMAEETAAILSRHDLGLLLKKKPGLTIKRMNAGTKKVFADIEEASRAD